MILFLCVSVRVVLMSIYDNNNDRMIFSDEETKRHPDNSDPV